MGIKANLIGHNGYLDGNTATFIQTSSSVGDYYQPIYLQKINQNDEKGTVTACQYNEVYYNVKLGQFSIQGIPEFQDYPYIYDYFDNRITSNTYAQCILSAEDATSGMVSPIVKTSDKILRLYANKELSDLTLQTLALFNLHKAEEWTSLTNETENNDESENEGE